MITDFYVYISKFITTLFSLRKFYGSVPGPLRPALIIYSRCVVSGQWPWAAIFSATLCKLKQADMFPRWHLAFLVTSGLHRHPCFQYFCLGQGSNSSQMLWAGLEPVVWGIHTNHLAEAGLGKENRAGGDFPCIITFWHGTLQKLSIWYPKLVSQVDKRIEA